jgi:hypothetical protein
MLSYVFVEIGGRRRKPQRPLLASRADLANLLAQGDLALWASLEGHLQLRDSVGISPTSLTRGNPTLLQTVTTLLVQRVKEVSLAASEDLLGQHDHRN